MKLNIHAREFVPPSPKSMMVNASELVETQERSLSYEDWAEIQTIEQINELLAEIDILDEEEGTLTLYDSN